MSLYWLFCSAVALRTDYLRVLLSWRWNSSLPSLSKLALLFSLLATLAPQPFYFRAVAERAAAARPGGRDWAAICFFAFVNSLLETAVFKAVVELGASPFRSPPSSLSSSSSSSSLTPPPSSSFLLSFFFSSSPPPPPPPPSLRACLASFLLLSAYCGVAHALFWDKFAFPPHRPPLLVPEAKEAEEEEEEEEEELRRKRAKEEIKRQRSAMNAALALFFPMSAAWHRLLLLSSSSSSDLAVVVALHAVADFSAAFCLRLQGPSLPWQR